MEAEKRMNFYGSRGKRTKYFGSRARGKKIFHDDQEELNKNKRMSFYGSRGKRSRGNFWTATRSRS